MIKRIDCARFLFVAIAQLSMRATAQLPEGLTCGLTYFADGEIRENNSCNGVPTFTLFGGLATCYGYDQYCSPCQCLDLCDPVRFTCTIYSLYYGPQAAPGYAWVFDGDFGASSGDGFYHQRLVNGVTDPAQASTFVLPHGTACGLHHTHNSPGLTCMGFDAAKGLGLDQDGDAPGIPGCPPGWAAKAALDRNSPNRYWAWCEYLDSNHLSRGNPSVQPLGVACGLSHNDRVVGAFGHCMGYSTYSTGSESNCPPGMRTSRWRDMGEPSNIGLGFCTQVSNPLPDYLLSCEEQSLCGVAPSCRNCTCADIGMCGGPYPDCQECRCPYCGVYPDCCSQYDCSHGGCIPP
jgi:hypothetical protein